jgi:hypothetical protein
MKFRVAQRAVFGSKMIDSMERESVEADIAVRLSRQTEMTHVARRVGRIQPHSISSVRSSSHE